MRKLRTWLFALFAIVFCVFVATTAYSTLSGTSSLTPVVDSVVNQSGTLAKTCKIKSSSELGGYSLVNAYQSESSGAVISKVPAAKTVQCGRVANGRIQIEIGKGIKVWVSRTAVKF